MFIISGRFHETGEHSDKMGNPEILKETYFRSLFMHEQLKKKRKQTNKGLEKQKIKFIEWKH